MGRDVSTISTIIAGRTYFKVQLVEIDNTPSQIRYTNWDVAVTQTIESVVRTFVPFIYRLSGIGANQDRGLQPAVLSIANVDASWGAIVLSVAGSRNRRVQVWEGWYDPVSFAWKNAFKVFDGRTNGAQFDEQMVTLQLQPRVPLVRIPSAVFSPNCPYRFKGKWCQYIGADTTCTRTFVDCTSKVVLPPVATDVTGGGSLAAGTYVFTFTYTNGGVESFEFPVSNTITAALNDKAIIAGMLIGPPGSTKRTLYRSKVGVPAVRYKDQDINDNTTTTATSTQADGTLGVAGPGLATTAGNTMHFGGCRQLPDGKPIFWQQGSSTLPTRDT